jgi:hypothetical protein
VQHLWYRDFEQIVVSDAPEPAIAKEIAAMCAEYGVRHINLPQRTQDWGRTPALAGLQAARGEFVCFLSDDNAYLPNHFGPLIEAFDATPGLGFVYSSCLYDGRKELRLSPPLGANIDLGQPLFRRTMLADHIADLLPPFVMAWDWEMIAAFIRQGATWQHVDVTTFVFRLEAYPTLVEALA